MYRKTAFFAIFYIVFILIFPQYSWGSLGVVQNSTSFKILPESALPSIQGNTLFPVYNPETAENTTMYKRWVIVTAYSSTPDQTDATPFITANGSRVRDGIVASNFLPFGTKVRFPRLYGDKTFTVEDRMAKKNSHKIDIWFSERSQALQFGLKWTEVEIIR